VRSITTLHTSATSLRTESLAQERSTFTSDAQPRCRPGREIEPKLITALGKPQSSFARVPGSTRAMLAGRVEVRAEELDGCIGARPVDG
jgi:hypothetical protein